jgi:hypothetical protein
MVYYIWIKLTISILELNESVPRDIRYVLVWSNKNETESYSFSYPVFNLRTVYKTR